MTTKQLSLEERIRQIKYSDIKRIMETPNDLFSFQVRSQNPKNQKEVFYMVYRDKSAVWFCDCKDFIYKSIPKEIIQPEDKPDNYQCKHILRVRKMLQESFKRQMNKAKKEIEALKEKPKDKVDLGDIFN